MSKNQPIRKLLTCLCLTLIICSLSINASAQYCTGVNLGGGGCSAGQLINSVQIAGTPFNNSVASCTTVATGTITTFPISANTTATLVQGQSYQLSVTTDANNIISIWIDFDHNLVYDSYEWTQVCTTSVATQPNTVSILIPYGNYVGTTGMRIRSRQMGIDNGAIDACSQFGSGETEDYTVTISGGIPCAAPPTAGNANCSVVNTCPGTNFTLSLNGNSVGSGLSFQWQSSPNNTTWNSIQGASNLILSTNINTPTYFRCNLTCSGVTSSSSSVFVGVNPVIQCYCSSTATSNSDDDIGNVTFGALNNGFAAPALNNATSTNIYTDFTGLSPQTYFPGSSYPISVTQINRLGFYACQVSVFIDYNKNGLFDPNESVFSAFSNSAVGGNIMSGNVIIPLSVSNGITRMRVVLVEGTATAAACGTYTYGETEDYLINLQPAQACVAPPVVGTAVASQNTVCQSVSVSLQLIGNSIGLGQTYQWQSSANSLNWANMQGANATTFTFTPTQNSYYRCFTKCSGSSDTSNTVLVTMAPVSTCYCASGATNVVDDDIGNITFGSLTNGTAGPAINNSSSVNLYSNFTSLAPQSYVQTFNYPISITQINSAGFYACWANVFIDFNQDGDFNDVDERVFSAQTDASIGGNIVTGSVTIPISALPGNTRMRIVLAETSSATQSPCVSYAWGETEDYTITIAPITPCTAPPTAGSVISSAPSVCPHSGFTLSLTGNSIGLGLSYQWQVSADGTTWSNVVGATNANYSASQLAASYYRCEVTCSNVSALADSLLVPMEVSASTFSTQTGGVIPDNNTSVCYPILVSGINTQTSTFFGLTEVCINIQHPEVGELKVFLKSPQGDTVYLSENNGGLFANYDNTCFAMNGANGYIYAANAPFTGTFIPNYSINAFNDGQNPNGTWFLCVKDEAPSVTPPGQFLNATLSFCNNPPADPIIPIGGCSGTNAFGCQCPDGSQDCDLLPDMTASGLIIQNEHTESLGSLRMSNATPNIGWGPMEIHGSNQCYCDTVTVPCSTTICPNGQPVKELVKQTIYHKNHGLMTTHTHDAGFMSYHPSHGHVHVDAWGAFSLRIPTSNPDATTWPIVGTGSKVSFCLINLGNCSNNLGYCVDNFGNVITQANIPNSGFGSVTGCGTDQGIFTGNLDIYTSGLAGMQIDFPGACNGSYSVVSITDPNNNFLEQDETNNWVQVPITLTQQFPPSGATSFAYTAAGNTVSFINTTPLSSGYLWDFGDGTTDTTTNPTHTYAFGNSYTVKLIAINQCYTATSQPILITGLNETENYALGLSANPNPTNGNLKISYFLPQKNKVQIELFNLVGEKLLTLAEEFQEKGKQVLDVDLKTIGVKPGIYLLKLNIQGTSKSLRVVITR